MNIMEKNSDNMDEKIEHTEDTVSKTTKKIVNAVNENIGSEDAKKWLMMISEILEKLTEKHPTISLECTNVSFETEKPDDSGLIVPEGKIKINGKFTLSVE